MNATNKHGATPLHVTASQGPEEPEVDRMMTEVAEVLIAHGADVNATDKKGFTPLRYAIGKKRQALTALLRDHGGAD